MTKITVDEISQLNNDMVRVEYTESRFYGSQSDSGRPRSDNLIKTPCIKEFDLLSLGGNKFLEMNNAQKLELIESQLQLKRP